METLEYLRLYRGLSREREVKYTLTMKISANINGGRGSINWKSFQIFILRKKEKRKCALHVETRKLDPTSSSQPVRQYVSRNILSHINTILTFFFFTLKNFKISLKLCYYFILKYTEVSNFKFAYVRSCIRKCLASLSRDRGLK